MASSLPLLLDDIATILDDVGLRLSRMAGAAKGALGRGILRAAPWLMKFLMLANALVGIVAEGLVVLAVSLARRLRPGPRA